MEGGRLRINIARFILVICLLLIVVQSICCAATEVNQNNLEQKTEKVYHNIRKESDEQLDEILALESDTEIDDAFSGFDLMARKFLILWYSFRHAVIKIAGPGSLFCVVMGLIIAYIFRKDKPRKRRGVLLAIGGPTLFLIIIYGPLITSFFSK